MLQARLGGHLGGQRALAGAAQAQGRGGDGRGVAGGKGKRKKKAKPVSKPWETLGSETEIQEEKLITNRGLLSFNMQRPRRMFGQEAVFGDKDAHAM